MARLAVLKTKRRRGGKGESKGGNEVEENNVSWSRRKMDSLEEQGNEREIGDDNEFEIDEEESLKSMEKIRNDFEAVDDGEEEEMRRAGYEKASEPAEGEGDDGEGDYENEY
jgi:hypothetical protein